ncbi:hypothetical protein PVAP13_4KG096433 [Panicum virgatum]|uniref:Uncharacterized protein n=1 Tax=Panicum virgatum TaxID=38727 RepID=A0A8T0TGR1_PANVG|nr:hypothetical protein PVAP13_4KG096433 [Panicum virgatum]
MEALLHGMLGFFPIGEAVCSESDVVKLLVFQGASGGFGSSGLPESFFFLQDDDVKVRGDGHGAIVFFIDLAWRLVSSLSFTKGRESAPPGAFWAADFVGGAGRLPCQGNKDDGQCAPGGRCLACQEVASVSSSGLVFFTSDEAENGARRTGCGAADHRCVFFVS